MKTNVEIIKELTGEDAVDIFGNDAEEELEDLEDINSEELEALEEKE